MKDEIVKYAIAKLAKEAGFNYYTDLYYVPFMDKNKGAYQSKSESLTLNERLPASCCTAPTQSLLQKWLRDEKKIILFVAKGYGYEWYIHGTDLQDGTYYTYEEALDEGLTAALELLIKNETGESSDN